MKLSNKALLALLSSLKSLHTSSMQRFFEYRESKNSYCYTTSQKNMGLSNNYVGQPHNSIARRLVTSREDNQSQARDKEQEHHAEQYIGLAVTALELLPDEYTPDGGNHRSTLPQSV